MPLFLLVAFLVCFLPTLAAQASCVLTAEPRLIRSEGLAEPLGETVLQCTGGGPGQMVNGVIQFTVDSRLGNRLNGGVLQDVTLAVRAGDTWQVLPVPARSSGNSAVFEGLQLSYDAQGRLALRIAGLRAQGQSEVRGFFSFLATPALPVPTPVVLIGKGEASLLSGYVNASFSTLTTRVTENVASAFGGPGNLGARILLRFQNVPKDGRVLLPNFVAGSNAVTPTSAGAMSLSNSTGAWQSGSSTLLLIRVDGADANGAGGTLTYTPQSGLNSPEGSGEAQSGEEMPYAVYEIVSADPAVLEFAEIPAHLSFPQGWQGRLGVVKPLAQLAPVSAAPGPSETLPVPRFSNVASRTDCERLGDCRASYFPRVVSFLNGETKPGFEMPAESESRNQFIAVRNDFGGLAEWRVAPRYKSGDGWLKLHGNSGINNATVAWYYDTRRLAPGRYEADLVVEITNGPAGLLNEQRIPLTLNVTPAMNPPVPEPPKPEPPKPEPVRPAIRDIVNPATGWATPVAPGALFVIQGDAFAETSQVRIDGLSALVVQRSATELLVEAPLALVPGRYVPVVVQQEGLSSGIWGVDVVPAAPATFHATNEDGTRNSRETPAVTGGRMVLSLNGIRNPGTLTVLLHDRTIQEPRLVEQDPPLPGVDLLSFTIPEDLPAMSTAVTVCSTGAPGFGIRCSEPFEVFLRKP